MGHHPLRELLEFLIRPLVDDPERVKLDWVETPKVSLFYLTARRGDLGRILGKGGQTIEDIRRVMEAVAAHHGREVVIDVVEPPKTAKPQKQKPKRRRSRRRKSRASSPAQGQAQTQTQAQAQDQPQPQPSSKRKRGQGPNAKGSSGGVRRK